MKFLLPLLATIALAACGSSPESPNPVPPAAATGPGITVEQALAAKTTEQLLVRGTLVAQNGTIRLCSALLESYPPQCGQPSLVVEGFDPAELPDLKTAGGVTWSDSEVKLLGTVADGSLTVSTTATA